MDLVDAAALSGATPADLQALQVSVRASSDPLIRVCAVGDLGLSGRAAVTARQRGADQLFREVRAFLDTADIVFGNLESPLAGDIAPDRNFAAPASGARTLHDAGFDVVHLANNHVGEYGSAGLAATLRAVRDAGMAPLGAGNDRALARQLIRTDTNGVRVGWLGCGRPLLPQENAEASYWEFDEQEVLEDDRAGTPERRRLNRVDAHRADVVLVVPRRSTRRWPNGCGSASDLIVMH